MNMDTGTGLIYTSIAIAIDQKIPLRSSGYLQCDVDRIHM